jgi:hypothetical protein
VKTGIDIVNRFLIDGGADTYFQKTDCILGSKVEYELSDKSNFKYSVWLI